MKNKKIDNINLQVCEIDNEVLKDAVSIDKKQRDISIDILKCLAALVITNSHMEILYGRYSALATGGAIGDVLFFFCSGYTLFLGRNAGFFNWYKRRVKRIYPTLFAWALMAALLFGIHADMPKILISGGGWFVSCIMIYYVVLWFVKRFAIDRMMWVFAGAIAAVIGWYLVIGIDDRNGNNMYGNTYFKWCYYFLYMLMGAWIGLKKVNGLGLKVYGLWKTILLLIVSTVAFYGLCWFKNKEGMPWDALQMLSLIPLAGVCWSFYQLCNTELLKKAYENKAFGACIRFIGGLCLEIYLVQYSLLTDKMNSIFPLNLVVMFLIILVAAYLLRCVARIWSQTFKDGDYDWKEITRII